MPKRIEGVSARLLDCAKSEFLSKGFRNASIREIAQKANTSPRAIYTRFPDKEGLFNAVLEPVADGFLSIFQGSADSYWNEQIASPETLLFSEQSTQVYHQLMDYIYEYKDEFTLILTCAEGTRYDNFIEYLTEANCSYIRSFNDNGELNADFEVTMKLTHMLTHSFYAGLFEPLLHEMNQKEAHFYLNKLCEFFSYGVKGILGK